MIKRKKKYEDKCRKNNYQFTEINDAENNNP